VGALHVRKQMVGDWRRIQIGAKLVAGDAGSGFDLQHTKRRARLPLADGRRTDAQRPRKRGVTACQFDCFFKGCFAHALIISTAYEIVQVRLCLKVGK